jgi:hypothetical protein
LETNTPRSGISEKNGTTGSLTNKKTPTEETPTEETLTEETPTENFQCLDT